MKIELLKDVIENIKVSNLICEELDPKYKSIQPMIDSLCERIQNEVPKSDILDLWNEMYWFDILRIYTKEEFISDNTFRKIHPSDAIEYMKRASEGYWNYDDEYMYFIDDDEVCSSNLDELFIFNLDVFKGIIYKFVNNGDFENFFHFDEPTSGFYEEDLRINKRIKSFVGDDLVEPIIRLAIAIEELS